METYEWYQQLAKPPFSSPAEVFGPVWSVLYALIIVGFGWAFWAMYKGQLPKKAALPLVINLAANAAFTPLQFGFRSNELALLDILIVLGSLIWALKLIGSKSKLFLYTQLPYLLWVLFATYLQIGVTLLN